MPLVRGGGGALEACVQLHQGGRREGGRPGAALLGDVSGAVRRPGASPWIWAGGGSEGGWRGVVIRPLQRAVQSIEEQGTSSRRGEF